MSVDEYKPIEGQDLDVMAETIGLKRYIEVDKAFRARLQARLKHTPTATKDSLWFALRDTWPGLGFTVEENLAKFEKPKFWATLWRILRRKRPEPIPAQVIVRAYVPSGESLDLSKLSDVIRGALPAGVGLKWHVHVNGT